MTDKEELKTLKEAHDFYEKNWRELNLDFIDYLKAEAVKWVKKEKSIYINAEKFFNLTEEDLKEQKQK